MCTIDIGMSLDKFGTWHVQTSVRDHTARGLERRLVSLCQTVEPEDEMQVRPLDIQNLLKLNYKEADSLLAIISDRSTCFAIPASRLISGWNHSGGIYGRIEGKSINVTDFTVQIISLFSLPSEIHCSEYAKSTIESGSKSKTSTVKQARPGQPNLTLLRFLAGH
jgi:hypothetical protein